MAGDGTSGGEGNHSLVFLFAAGGGVEGSRELGVKNGLLAEEENRLVRK